MSDARTIAVAANSRAARLAGLWQTVMILFKLRIVTLLLLAAMGGAFVAAGGVPRAADLLLLLITGGASAAGASALNQFIERERDALMRRTKRRPLPEGVVQRPGLVLVVGLGLIVGAVALAAIWNGTLAFWLGVGAWIYVGVYTLWLKPRSITNIVIGGAAGSCAVLSGGAAVGAWNDVGVLTLAALLFTWTPMHFWSLALVYRDDYAAANVPMLPVYTTPLVAARWVLLHGAVTALMAVLLAVHPAMGLVYLVPTVAATIWMLWAGVAFLRVPERANALMFFKASNLYLLIVLLAVCGAAVL